MIGFFKIRDSPYYLRDDPKYEDVRKLWPKSHEHIKPINYIQLDSICHVQLFYTYRNSLVHELRKLGHGIEFKDDSSEPYYHSILDIDKGGHMTWELVYPLGFLKVSLFVYRACSLVILS